MAFEDVATLLLILDADNRASEKIDEAKRSIEEYAAAVDAAAADVAAASAAMDENMGNVGNEVKKADEDFQRLTNDVGSAGSGFQHFNSDVTQAATSSEDLAKHAEAVRQEMEYLNGAVENLHQPMAAVKQDIQDLDNEMPKAASEADIVRAAMADLKDEEEKLASETESTGQAVNKVSGDLQDGNVWWREYASQQRQSRAESEKVNQALGDVKKGLNDAKGAAEEAKKGLEDADAEVKRIGPDFDKAMASAQGLANKLFLLRDSSKKTSSGFMGMSGPVLGIIALIAGLSGAIGGVLALGVPAFFLALGGGAAYLKDSLDKLQASGQQLTATQKAELAIVTPLANAFAQLKPVMDQAIGSITKWAGTLGPALKLAFGAMGPMITTAVNGVEQFIGILVNNFAPMMKQIQPVVTAFWQGMTQVANGLVGMMQAIDFSQAAQGLKDFFNAIGQLLVLIGQLVTALAPIGHFLLGQILPAVIELAGGITRVLGGAFKAAGPALSQFADAFSGLVKVLLPLLAPLGELAGKLLPPFLSVFTGIVKEITVGVQPIVVLVSAIANWISASKSLTTVLGIMIGVWVALRIAMSMNPFVALIMIVIFVAGLIITHWTQIKDFLIGVWNDIKDIATTVWNSVKDFFVGLWDAVSGFFRTVWNDIRNFLVGIILTIIADFITQWDGLKNWITGLWDGITGTIKAVWNDIKSWFTTLLAGIVAGFIAQWTQLKTFLSNLWTDVTGIFKGAGQWLLDAGGNIIKGLWQGISNTIGWLWGQIKNIGSGIVNEFKSFLHIFSPSQVMADEVGAYIPQGIAQGILAHASAVSDAAKKVTQGAITGAQMGFSMSGTLNAGNALGGGAGSGNVYLTFTGNQVMNSSSIQELADKAGQQVAKYMLPQGGRFVHS